MRQPPLKIEELTKSECQSSVVTTMNELAFKLKNKSYQADEVQGRNCQWRVVIQADQLEAVSGKRKMFGRPHNKCSK